MVTPLTAGTQLLRTGESYVYGIDLSAALLPGEALTAVASVACAVSQEPPFAEQWTADPVTITLAELTGGVSATALVSAGGTYAANATLALTVGAPAPGGTQAVLTAQTNGSGVVTGLTILTPGDGYATAPAVTFPAPLSGATATGTCSLLLDTISVTLDATLAPVAVGDWRRVIVAGATTFGETRKADEILFYTDL